MIPLILIAAGGYLIGQSNQRKILSYGDYLEDKPVETDDEVVFSFREDSWLEIYEDEEFPTMEIPFQAGETFEVVVTGMDESHYQVRFQDGSVAFIPKAEVSVVAVNDEVAAFKKGGETKYWIKDAIKKKGALRRTAKREGLIDSDETLSATDLKKLERKGGKTGQRARLAMTLKKMN